MRKSPVTTRSRTIGGALLALAAFASTADARMGGMGSSMSHGDTHTTMSSSPGSFRSSDARSFNASGRGFDVGVQTRVKGSNWKHPIDFDGGDGDPPKKPPKGSTQTGSNDGGKSSPDGKGGGWYGPTDHRPHYGHYGQGYGHSEPPPLACRGRVNGC